MSVCEEKEKKVVFLEARFPNNPANSSEVQHTEQKKTTEEIIKIK